MIKLIATGYSDSKSCEEIFLDEEFNVIKRCGVEGIKNASFIALKNSDSYFVSDESDKFAKIHEVNCGKVVDSFYLDTLGIVCLEFLEKCGIIISGSYTLGDIFFNNEKKFKVNSAHCIVSDDDERFLYVTDIKGDRIIIYDLTSFSLVDEFLLPIGTGPRHLKFYKGFLYLVTEYSNEVFVFLQDKVTGGLSFLYKYSSFFLDNEVNNFAAAIDIRNDVLGVSNRGKNVISFFNILDDGSLKRLYEFSCFGDWPRDIKFYKDFLFVANERSGEICIFRVLGEDVKLVSRIEKEGVNFISLVEGDFDGL